MDKSYAENFDDLRVYQDAFAAAMTIFELSKGFPKEETYSLTDQIRRSSRSVCSNLAEAWQKRRYQAAFVAKLSDAMAEAAETQSWLRFTSACQFLSQNQTSDLSDKYSAILKTLNAMAHHSASWCKEEVATYDASLTT